MLISLANIHITVIDSISAHSCISLAKPVSISFAHAYAYATCASAHPVWSIRLHIPVSARLAPIS